MLIKPTVDEPHTMIEVAEARYIGGYTLWLRFENGVEGEIDFTDDLKGRIFGALRDVELFKSFSTEYGALDWPNGAGICHSVLYKTVLGGVPSTRPV
jgi:hypothetical protein